MDGCLMFRVAVLEEFNRLVGEGVRAADLSEVAEVESDASISDVAFAEP